MTPIDSDRGMVRRASRMVEELMMKNLYVILIAALSILEVSAQTPVSLFDTSRLQTGQFAYRIMQDGKQVATFTITIRREGDRYRFVGEGFNQRWESIVGPAFEPVSATIKMEPAGRPAYSMRLAYDRGRVTGAQIRAAAETAVDAALPPGTIDQRLDWAAMLSIQSALRQELRFPVYDPQTDVSTVVGSAVEMTRITVPAGAYDALRLDYKVQKSSGVETYQVLATRDVPRMMVRENFPNGLILELVTATVP